MIGNESRNSSSNSPAYQQNLPTLHTNAYTRRFTSDLGKLDENKPETNFHLLPREEVVASAWFPGQ